MFALSLKFATVFYKPVSVSGHRGWNDLGIFCGTIYYFIAGL